MPRLPQALSDHQGSPAAFLLSDSGLETTLVFHDGMELPGFAAFPLLTHAEGRRRLRRWYQEHLAIARTHGLGFILETPTWRSNARWGAALGYDAGSLDRINQDAIGLLRQLRDELTDASLPTLLSGCVGPLGDGYTIEEALSPEAAAEGHAPQIRSFYAAGADLATAHTMNYVAEALGVVMVAQHLQLPVVISFTVETDGRLPSGEELPSAIRHVDDATGSYPAWYMINCAHPSHFAHLLRQPGTWRERLRGVRANASRCSHAELEAMETLDDGDPQALARDYRSLCNLLPGLLVLGGCCGTDARHIRAIAQATGPADDTQHLPA